MAQYNDDVPAYIYMPNIDNLSNIKEIEESEPNSTVKTRIGKQVAQRATIAHLRALGSRYYATKFKMDHINSKREKVKSSIF